LEVLYFVAFLMIDACRLHHRHILEFVLAGCVRN